MEAVHMLWGGRELDLFKDLREDDCGWSQANREKRRKDELGKRGKRGRKVSGDLAAWMWPVPLTVAKFREWYRRASSKTPARMRRREGQQGHRPSHLCLSHIQLSRGYWWRKLRRFEISVPKTGSIRAPLCSDRIVNGPGREGYGWEARMGPKRQVKDRMWRETKIGKNRTQVEVGNYW